MARKREGQVVERVWKAGRGYALRFIAYGERQYLTLGLEADGWTRAKAEQELANVIADVRRGIWIPPNRNTPKPAANGEARPEENTFGEFARERLSARKLEVSENTHGYEEWALELHLLPYFTDWRLPEFTIEAIDEYRAFKVTQAQERRTAILNDKPSRKGSSLPRPLSARSINKTIDVLQAYLQVAVEYGHLPTNPAAGRRRRLKTPGRRPVHLDTVEQIVAMLDAAELLDRDPRFHLTDRKAQVATLMFAGPRAHEHTAIQLGDIDLTNARIEIGRSKTQAGLREIQLLPILKTTLATHRKQATDTRPQALAFATEDGTPRDKDNLRNRVLAPVIKKANELLRERGHPPLPAGLSPHKLRHTFASILVACGEDPASVMAQLGHTDPTFTLRVYTHLMRRDPKERARLKALVYNQPIEYETDDDALPEAA